MPQAKKNPTGPGAFCWYELATNDTTAAKAFYHELLGVELKDMPMPAGGPGGTYTLLELKGKQTGGMYQLLPEMVKMKVPPHWASYIAVEDIDMSFEKARSLGAVGLTPVMEVGDMGRSVMLKDPTGAAFALFQARGDQSNMTLEQVHGNRCWNELYTGDVDQAGRFYKQLLGWKLEPMTMPGNTQYTVFQRGQEPIGGMMKIAKEWGPVPPHWLVYFEVDNIEKAVEIVKKHKGQLHGQIMEAPEVGRFAMLMDPQGAAFGLVQSPK